MSGLELLAVIPSAISLGSAALSARNDHKNRKEKRNSNALVSILLLDPMS